MIDVDNFKSVNDTYGHLTGDVVLRSVAQVCGAALRPHDMLCRYGGEELLAVLPGADAIAIASVGERIRAAVDTAVCVPPGGNPLEPIRVTVSVGGASTASADLAGRNTTMTELIAHADAALYLAKRSGRNRVVVPASPPRGGVRAGATRTPGR